MATIRTVGLDARNRLASRKLGDDARGPYREVIANLSGDRVVEVTLDEGGTMRQVKLNVSRAAKETDRQVAYGETEEGTLLVWLEAARLKRRRRSARPE